MTIQKLKNATPSSTAKLQRELAEAKRTIRTLSDQLDDLTKNTFKLKALGKPATIGKGSYFRVAFGDTHGIGIDQDAFNAFTGDLAHLEPKEIVGLGDHVDCGGFLAQHHTLGYVAETSYTYSDDISSANQQLDRIQTLCPNARIHYLQGNHERRVEKWCVTQSLRNTEDAEMLRRAFDPEYLLHLEKRGITYYRQSKFYHDLRVPGTILLGKCHFTHGDTASKHECSQMVARFNANVVFGHTHRADSFTKRTVKDGVIAAWNPGCLCKLQKYWNHTKLTNWSHGYALQIVRKSGDFLHINVPIIDGKSYLADFIKLIK